MNNEPVAIPFAWYCAWLDENNQPVWDQYEECHPATKQWDNFPDKTIPLYTHPVKQLSDEEIDKLKALHTKMPPKPWNGVPLASFDVYGFARAIIKEITE